MEIITTICPAGPMKSRECLAFFGVEYQTYLILILISAILGFSLSFIYLKLRKQKIDAKFLTIGSLISLLFFIALSILNIWLVSKIIY
jgi:hypothetical protein